MKNEHGIQCPIDWKNIHPDINWIAVDHNGEVWGYVTEPYQKFGFWESWGEPLQHVANIAPPPTDFTKCLWRRPKKDGKKM